MRPTINLLFLLFMSSVYGQTATSYKWVSAESGLRMRSGASLEAPKLGVIPFGERVKFMSQEGDTQFLAGTDGKWTEVNWNGQIAWVYDGFLSDLPVRDELIEEFSQIDVINKFISDAYGKELNLCRIEFNGANYMIDENGDITNSSDISPDRANEKTIHLIFENGIRYSKTEGHELGGWEFEFSTEFHSPEQVFELAAEIYSEKYLQYLESDNGTPLPPQEETMSLDEQAGSQFEVYMKDDLLKGIKIVEMEGCINWWVFEVKRRKIIFGNGFGC